MGWLDPDRLASLYGQGASSSSQQDGRAQRRARKKASKKLLKELRHGRRSLRTRPASATVLPPIPKINPKKLKAVCCEKYLKGRRCRRCPLG